MSRPGIWHMVWIYFKKSLSRGSVKQYVGEDVYGNRYYQLVGKRKSVIRGYDVKEKSSPEPSVEWLAWLRGTRKFPPFENEMPIDSAKQQAEALGNAALRLKAPAVGVHGSPVHTSTSTSFPRYVDLEDQPGVSKNR